MHSKKSDGSDRPSQMARYAQAVGLTAVALTDHDTTEGNARFRSALEELNAARSTAIEFVPGCEISCKHEGTGTSTHVLCYFVGDDPKLPIQEMLADLRDDRDNRNVKLVRLLQDLGYTKIKKRRIAEIANKPLGEAGRPHFAEAFLEAYPPGSEAPEVAYPDLPTSFATVQSVFDGVLDASARGYIPKANITPAKATEAATASNAVTVLAHPILTFCKPPKDGSTLSLADKLDILEPIFAEMAAAGVSGAEAYYSRNSPEETSMLLELCRSNGLVATGGSDYHGEKKKDLEIGIGMRASRGTDRELKVPDSVIGELRARRAEPDAPC
jgi:hypothetical protein